MARCRRVGGRYGIVGRSADFRLFALPRSQGTVGALRRSRIAGPALVRPDEALGQGTAGAAHPRVSEDSRGEHQGPGERRPRQQLRARAVPRRRHAVHDDRLPAARIRRHAGHDLRPDRRLRSAAPHLHRRARLAGRHRADHPGLLDRKMDRRGRRRQVRRAPGRDARLQGQPRVRHLRHSDPPRQQVGVQGAHLRRQARSRTCSTTRSP